MSAAGRPKCVRCYLNEIEGLSQTKPDGSVDGKRTSRKFSIMQYPPNAAFSPPDATAVESFLFAIDPPSLEEICTAVRQLRNNRDPGEDGIPAEVYETRLDSLGPWLHRVITKLWMCEAIPNNWSGTVLLPLFKKGDKRMCSNYGGICLIAVAVKVFGAILHKSFLSEKH